MTEGQVDDLLCHALGEILEQVSQDSNTLCSASTSSSEAPLTNHNDKSPLAKDISAVENVQQSSVSKYSLVFIDNAEIKDDASSNEGEISSPEPGLTPNFSQEEFHSRLRLETFLSIDDVLRRLKENVSLYKKHFGVLQFLYSVLLTKVCLALKY